MNNPYDKIINILIEAKKRIIEGETTGGKGTMDRINNAIARQRSQNSATSDINAFLASREGRRQSRTHPSVRWARGELPKTKTKPILRSRKGVGELEARGWKGRKEANRDSFALERRKRIEKKIEDRKTNFAGIMHTARAREEADDALDATFARARKEADDKGAAWEKGEVAAPRWLLRRRGA